MAGGVNTAVLRRSAGPVLAFWPLWASWPLSRGGLLLWRHLVLVPAATRRTPSYDALWRAWPVAGVAGPIAALLAACALHRAGRVTLATPLAGMAGVLLAAALVAVPEARAVMPYIGRTRPLALIEAASGHLYALGAALVALAVACDMLWGKRLGRAPRAGLQRGASDNFGHADWLPIAAAERLFPGDDAGNGIVIGEAYRVDLDRSARGRFDPADARSWGQGGKARLLVDPCRDGSTHGLVIAGSGGFKTSGTGIPTMLHWRSSAVVLDPSREIAPMIGHVRAARFGHRVITLDPSDANSAGFNVLDWIDVGAPLAETNVEAVATWLAGEPLPGAGAAGGAEFFRDMGRTLVACLLADLLWDEALAPAERTLRTLRARLVQPEGEMRRQLAEIHGRSASPLARDYAGTLMGLVEETFSGVYANATQATRWLSTAAYADLVSGKDFRTAELAGGALTVFVQIPLKALEATPGLGRVIVGSLLNAAYEADGAVRGRILFLLDEVARLGPMRVLTTARDAGRKYGLTLLLLYQSVGQLVEQWGRDGARAWYDSVSWRLYAAVSDPDTARELSAICGDYAVLATSHGDTRGRQRRAGGGSSTGRSENRTEVRRALIKPDEMLHDVRTDEAFVIRRGARPLRCGRAIWFRRRDMLALVDASRFHPLVQADDVHCNQPQFP